MMDTRTIVMTGNSALTTKKGLGDPLELKRLCKHILLDKFRCEMDVLLIAPKIQLIDAKIIFRLR